MIKKLISKCLIQAFLLILPVSSLFCQESKSDTKKGSTTGSSDSSKHLYFNKKGQWIEGFPDKIDKCSQIQFHFVDSLDRRVFNKLKAANDTLKNLTDNGKVKSFLIRHPLLLRLFHNSTTVEEIKSSDIEGIIVAEFTRYKDELINYFQELKDSKNYSDAKKKAGINTYYLPGLVSNFDSSFSIIIKNQHGANITFRIADKNFKWGSDTSIAFEIYRELKDNQAIADHYKMSYKKYNPVDWILQKQRDIDKENKELLEEVDKLMTQWEREKEMGERDNAQKTLAKLITKQNAVQNYITQTANLQQLLVQKNREWIKCWLWFTNWEPVMNPLELFGFTKDDRMKELKKRIDSSKENVSYLTKLIENKNLKEFANFEEMKKATEQLAGMTASVKELEAEYNALDKEKKSIAESRAVISINKQLVHYAELFSSNNDKWQPMRFHDYNKGLEFVNKTENNQQFWDGDDEKLLAANVPAGVNVSLTEKVDSYMPKSYFSQLIDPVLDDFLKSVNDNLSGLQEQETKSRGLFSSKKISPSDSDYENDNKNAIRLKADIGNLKEREKDNKVWLSMAKGSGSKDGFKTTEMDSIQSEQKNIIAQLKAKNDTLEQLNIKLIKSQKLLNKAIESNQEEYSKNIQINYDSIKILKKWFSLQTNAFPAYELSTPEDTILRSLPLRPKEAIATGNNKDTYTIYKRTGTAKEEKAASWVFKKYELKRLDAIAGLVFVNDARSSLLYDPASQTFSSKDIGSSDVMLGIKFFPSGVWLEDKKFFGRGICKEKIKRGLSVINRLAITGAVGVQKSPLRNFFAGFSYDILTGLSINYGWNFYTKKDYDIRNGAIEKEYESFVRTPYWGITMAPATLLKVLKIINLKP